MCAAHSLGGVYKTQCLWKKSVMIITLHDKQQICVDSRIRFQHRADSGRRYEVVLNKRQLQNLNDAIIHRDEFHSLLHFPLGGSLWLFRKENITKLFDNKRHLFFSFYASAWHFYVRSIHKSLYDYIIHGKPYNYQSYAKHESRLCHSFGRSPSFTQEHFQTLSRSARNVDDENGKWSKCTVFPSRKGSNTWAHIRRRGRKHASRIHRKTTTNRENAACSDNENDSFEFSNECSIEEESLSPEDRID